MGGGGGGGGGVGVGVGGGGGVGCVGGVGGCLGGGGLVWWGGGGVGGAGPPPGLFKGVNVELPDGMGEATGGAIVGAAMGIAGNAAVSRGGEYVGAAGSAVSSAGAAVASSDTTTIVVDAGSAAMRGATTVGSTIANSNIGSAVIQGANAAGSAVANSGVGSAMLSAAGSAASAALEAVPKLAEQFDADAVLGCIGKLVECGAAVPIVGAVAVALSGVCEGIAEAKVNKLAVQSMGLRIHEVALTLAELLPAAVEAGQVTPALSLHLRGLEGLLKKATSFVGEYGKRGFLSRIMKSHWDGVAVRQLDTDLSGSVNDIAMLLGVIQMRMQQRTFDEVEKISSAVQDAKDNGGFGGPGSAQAIAEAAGMSREEASQELAELKDAIMEELSALKEGQKAVLGNQSEMLELLRAVAGNNTHDSFVEDGRRSHAFRRFAEFKAMCGVGPETLSVPVASLVQLVAEEALVKPDGSLVTGPMRRLLLTEMTLAFDRDGNGKVLPPGYASVEVARKDTTLLEYLLTRVVAKAGAKSGQEGSFLVDTTGDGKADHWYDATSGRLCVATEVDTDGSGVVDAIAVDIDGDGDFLGASDDLYALDHSNVVRLLGDEPAPAAQSQGSSRLPADGAVAWYDSWVKDSVRRGGQGQVIQWDDLSGNKRHAVASQGGMSFPTFAENALSGHDAVRFQSGQTLVAASPCRVKTVAFFVKMNSLGAFKMIFAQHKNEDFSVRMNYRQINNADKNDFCWGQPHKLWINGSNQHDFTWDKCESAPAVITAVKYDGRADGSDFIFQLSSNFHERGFDGMLGEVIVYDRELSYKEIEGINEYLQNKWLPPVPSGMETVRLTVPQGAKAGDKLKFKLPDGREATIQVPPGAVPGQAIEVKLPRRAPAPAAKPTPAPAAPKFKDVTIQLPAGAFPGQLLKLQLGAGGTVVQIKVPPGSVPGQRITLRLPA